MTAIYNYNSTSQHLCKTSNLSNKFLTLNRFDRPKLHYAQRPMTASINNASLSHEQNKFKQQTEQTTPFSSNRNIHHPRVFNLDSSRLADEQETQHQRSSTAPFLSNRNGHYPRSLNSENSGFVTEQKALHQTTFTAPLSRNKNTNYPHVSNSENSDNRYRTWAEAVSFSMPRKKRTEPRDVSLNNRSANQKSDIFPNNRRRSWKHDLHLLNGTSNDNVANDNYSVVASNIDKGITTAIIQNWFSKRNLPLKECTLLTTSNNARFLSYKITFQPNDFDRVTSDSSIWPSGVKVRQFKTFNSDNEWTKVTTRQHRYRKGSVTNNNQYGC